MKYLFLASSCVSTVFALQDSPWLGDTYEFYLHSDVVYSQYRKIDKAVEQPGYTYRNYVAREGLSFSFSSCAEIEAEVELARTPHQLFGFRSFALSGKYLLLDDIAGDPISFSLAANIRNVGVRAVADVSSPYAAYWNFEAVTAIGKEFTKIDNWTTRGYAVASVGIAHLASFWNRFEAAFEGKIGKSNVGKVFCLAYLGYGPKIAVDIDHFQGWGKISHRSIDVGLQYRYVFQTWGEVGLSYAYRLLAISYPKQEQTITLSYNLPFSLF
jgi:hypothetical protein